MRVPRIVFSVLAIVMAVGAAFASKSSSPDLFQGYIQLTQLQCQQSIKCDNGGEEDCMVGDDIVYRVSNGTQCSIPLSRSKP